MKRLFVLYMLLFPLLYLSCIQTGNDKTENIHTDIPVFPYCGMKY